MKNKIKLDIKLKKRIYNIQKINAVNLLKDFFLNILLIIFNDYKYDKNYIYIYN